MGIIVCATRGGEGSRAVQLEAIDAARQSGKHLIFLYVVDTTLLPALDEVLNAAVRAEFHWLGEALLRIALQRAQQAGLEADFAIREGTVREELERFLSEVDADLLLLGAPRNTTALFGDDSIERFAHAIQQNTAAVSVRIVRPEQVDHQRALE